MNRRQHYNEWRNPGTKTFTRKIGNFINYRTPSGLYLPTDVQVETPTKVPDDWEGTFEFQEQSVRAPLQIFVGDSTDPSNTALVGFRLSDRPKAWVNYKALGVNAVPMERDRPNRRVRWVNLWQATNLVYQFGRHKLDRIIRLKNSNHPARFRFAIRHPPGATVQFGQNRFRILDARGRERFRVLAPYATDDNGDTVRVTMYQGNDLVRNGKTFTTFWVHPNASDLAGATYPVTIQ